MIDRLRLAALLLSLCPLPTLAQSPARYLPQSDTVWYASANPWTMYWVRAEGDTVGGPIVRKDVERHVWMPGEPMRVEVVQTDPGMRTETTDTFVVNDRGRVLEIRNARNRSSGGRWDLFMRLPAPPVALEPGVAWSDTLSDVGTDPNGNPHRYVIRREMEVARMIDTLDTRVAEVHSTGDLDFALRMVVDSTTGAYLTLDSRGPTTERFLFDTRRGRIVRQSWDMHLRGTGTLPNSTGGRDTVPAGLRSSSDMWLVDESTARTVIRSLPGADTSRTTTQNGASFVHTVDRKGSTIESGFARTDGMVATARATFGRGTPDRFEVLWTQVDGEARSIGLRPEGDRIVFDDGGSSAIPPEAEVWAAADYLMDELVVPALLTVPMDEQPHAIAIYRPYARKWDVGQVFVAPVEDLRIAVLQMEGSEGNTYLIFDDEADLLYVEVERPNAMTVRWPAEGTERRAHVAGVIQRALGSQQAAQ